MPTCTDDAVPRAAWRVLALGVAAQAAGTFLVSTPVYLIPLLHERDGLSLSRAGTLAAAPTFGMVLTLVAWGALADRFGERWVIAGGLALTAVAALVAAPVDDLVLLGVLLALGGAASASTNAASGRVVVGWFPARRRGLAMGVRQVSQPLGVVVAAAVVPPLAARHGTGAPLLLAGAGLLVLALACAAGVRNPPRPSARAATAPTPNPYRRDGFLWRVHAVSLLLVVPQFTLSTFGLVWLTVGLGWDPTAAGVLVGAAQFVGAAGRVAVGALSDRVGSRVRVLRRVAVAGVLVLLALALSGAGHVPLLTGAVLVLATTVSVADNGLAFTSVAEAAGPRWSGRALGVQNTGQFLAASAVGPGIGALVPLVGFVGAVALVALAPLAALPLLPRRDRHA